MTTLTLETAVQMTRQAEDIAKQISQQEGQPMSSLQEVTSRQSSKAANRSWMKEKNKRSRENRKEDTECGRCSKTRHLDFRKCPAAGTECKKCSKKGTGQGCANQKP